MGRELRRVQMDFSWPLGVPWEGFVNPHYTAHECDVCGGTGMTPEARGFNSEWCGRVPFRPEDRGSRPHDPNASYVVDFARRNVTRAPEHYLTKGEAEYYISSGEIVNHAIEREAVRLASLWNSAWSHHLNDEDVKALVAAGRLIDFTHTFEPGEGWKPKDPPYVPWPEEVNAWSCGGLGHDSINAHVCIEARCERAGVGYECSACDGEAVVWPSPEAKQAYESWEPIPPPDGEGYQIWENVTEGSPVSPVFATPEELARHMAANGVGLTSGTTYEMWLEFIRRPGWAPTMVFRDGKVLSGVEAAAR